jgi:aerobic carbon-monoxide dehydrogenase medium subunit
MIPVAFDYCRPRTLTEAHDALAAVAGEAVILSGGQSLMTDLKLRRKRPRLVVDLQAIEALSAVEVGDDVVRIGAMVRQADLVANAAVVSRLPLLGEIANVAADPMVRRRGTLVGALCAVEQGGDWLAGCLAMDGVVEIAGGRGTREMPLTEFVRGARATVLGDDEIAVAVRLRTASRTARSAYRKVKHIAIGWSIASVAAVLDVNDAGRCSFARIAVSGATTHPQRLAALENALTTLDLRKRDGLHDAVAASLSEVAFWGDYYASSDYRAERLASLLEQTVTEIAGP